MTDVKIYVSSTYRDLQGHRAAVSQAIRLLGYQDIAMEHYVAGPQRPLTKCLDDVRRCDLYVGLFARRYGYIPDGYNQSITEQEYRTALKNKKPVLCFMLEDDADWPEAFVEGGEAGEKLKRLQNEISTNRLVDFFFSPDELATKVLAAIVQTLDPGSTPLDIEREFRLMNEWRRGASRRERIRAQSALKNMGSPRYAAEIINLLLETDNVEEIASYLDDLLTLSVHSAKAMTMLIYLLHVENPETRLFAVFQIGELGLRGRDIPPEIVQPLMTLAGDEVAAVRGELAHTLGKIQHSSDTLAFVRTTLERLAQDPDEGVCERAADSLNKIQ